MEEKRCVGHPRIFATTHWSVVLAAQAHGDSGAARDALDELCRVYWHPLYFYLRRMGCSPADAEDLIQGFFEEFLAMGALAKVAPERGRFRSFLIACLKKFVARQRRRAGREKRGGGQVSLSLDIPNAEQLYGKLLAAGGDTPDEIYERQWAAAVLGTTLDTLRVDAEARGQTAVFELLHCTLLGETPSASYAELAERLEVSEGAVKMTAFRLRERFAELFRGEIARTVDRPEEVDEEIAHLLHVLAR